MMIFKKCGESWDVVLALMLALMSAILPQSAYAQPTASQPVNSGLPQDVREQLTNQAVAMAKISLEYEQSFTPSGMLDSSEDFDGGRFRQRIEIPALGGLQKQIRENAFDGQICYSGDPEESGGEVKGLLTKYSAADATDPDRMMKLVMFPYLNGAGFYVPDCVADMREPLIESLVLHYMMESDSTKIEKSDENTVVTVQIPDPVLTQVGGFDLEKRRRDLATGRNSPEQISNAIETMRKMQTMVPKRIAAFTLDAKRGCAVVKREEWTAAGKRIVVIQSDQWKHYESAGIWLPGRCVFSYYANPSLTEYSQQVMNQTTVQLNSIKFGPQRNISFILDYKKPGTVVLDRTTPEARANPAHMVGYTVAADGTMLRDRAFSVRHEINKGQRYFRVCVFLVLFGLPIIVLWWLIHKMNTHT